MMLYICTKFSQNIFDSFKLIQLMLKIKKGHSSARNVGKLTFLISAHTLIMLYICNKFHKNIFNGFIVIDGHNFHMNIT